MKNSIIVYVGVCGILIVGLTLSGCSRPDPVACFTTEKNTYDLGDEIQFNSDCSEDAHSPKWSFMYQGKDANNHITYSGCDDGASGASTKLVACIAGELMASLRVDAEKGNKIDEHTAYLTVNEVCYICYDPDPDPIVNPVTFCSEDYFNWWEMENAMNAQLIKWNEDYQILGEYKKQ